MSCVIFNSPAVGPTRRGATAQEEKRSPARTTARNPNVRRFTVTIPGVAKGKRLKAARQELCRIIRHLGSAMRHGTRRVKEWSERSALGSRDMEHVAIGNRVGGRQRS